VTAFAQGSIRWRKSSASGSGTTNCVELAKPDERNVWVRDSKNPAGSGLAFASPEWMTFLRRLPS
jgi:hypothetical protein